MQPFSPDYVYALMREQNSIKQAWQESGEESDTRVKISPGTILASAQERYLSPIWNWVNQVIAQVLAVARTAE